jgi:hypothetical protein
MNEKSLTLENAILSAINNNNLYAILSKQWGRWAVSL